MSKLFERLSVEEQEEILGGEEESTVEIEDVISDEEEQEEFNSIVDETEDDVAAMEEAEEVVEDLEEQIAKEEELLETPEKVTAADALVSQESLRMAAKMLGANPDEIFGQKVSTESAHESPVTALQLSTESAKEFVLKVIEQVKAIFKKIAISIKKMGVKVIALMTKAATAADKLDKSLNEKADKTESEVTEDDNKKIASKLGVVMLANGNSFADLKGYLDGINNPDAITRISVGLARGAKDLEGAVKSAKFEDHVKAVAAITNEVVSKTSMNKTMADISEFITKSGDKYFNGVMTNAGKRSMYLPYRFDGTVVKTVKLENDTEKEKEAKEKKDIKELYSVSSITVPTLSLKPAALKDVIVKAVPSKAEISGVLKVVIKNGENAKTFSDKVMAAIDSNGKLVETLEKISKSSGELTEASKAGIVKYTTATRVGVVNVGLEMILSQVQGTKAVLGVCAIFAGKYPKK